MATNYIIVYDPQPGQQIEIYELPGSEYEAARELRFELEMRYRKEGRDVEVVLIQAENHQALMDTHARYFEDIGTLMERRSTAERVTA